MVEKYLDKIRNSAANLFDSFFPIEKTCPHCNSRLYRAIRMSQDEGEEAGNFVEYHVCECEEAIVVRNEVRLDRHTPYSVSVNHEFHLNDRINAA